MTILLVSRMLAMPQLAAEFLAERGVGNHLAGWLFLHLVGGVVALASGCANIVMRKPGSLPSLAASTWFHRRIGQVYAAAVLASGFGAIFLVPHVTMDWGGRIGIGLLVPCWLAATCLAALAARAGRIEAHRSWILRSFAFTCAAISLRVQMVFLEVVSPTGVEDFYGLVMWTSWLPNLILAEWIIHRRGTRQPISKD
ncbi:DUF2306 domain-containing protein [Altererythrobacter sp. KTW20L]|uniref:DUF2306 domain-containing protein n=1 Tax=Altererythrobacter sp. KTW20L TaxID=2942210 RepID=UPI0020BD9715|nr:DUF2306 domain-containing protein [Altererythrobacter sp. KTW20L]MCL6251278.1 DUF2306 domain-containing protein [Altererythrobacter sp. KTW20L]